MENTTHLFLAVRFNCNKCHDHPFERWTQDQYYQLAAYFAQVELDGGPEVQGPEDRRHRRRRRRCRWSRVIADTKAGEVKHDRTGADRHAAVPLTPTPDMPTRRSRAARAAGEVDHLEGQPVLRQELRQPPLGLPARRRHHRADRRHPRRQPADQPRAARPPDGGVHRERLRRAAHRSRRSASRRTYQLSVATNKWNEDDDINYSHAHRPPAAGRGAVRRDPPRRPARRAELPGLPPGSRAAQLLDSHVRAARRLPRTVRQAGPRERLRVRAVERHDARAGPEPGQRPDRRRCPQGPEQSARQARPPEKDDTPARGRDLPRDPEPPADGEGGRDRASRHSRPANRITPRRWPSSMPR